MRILFVTNNLPVPPTNGQAIRTLSILQSLASLGHQLSFVSFATGGGSRDLEPLTSCCESIDLLDRPLTNMSQGADYLRRAACVLSHKPYSVERFRSSPMREKIADHLKSEKPDAVFCDSVYALVNVPETRIPILLNTHNVEYAIYERYYKLERNPVKKLYAGAEAKLTREAERKSCYRAVGVLACSQKDREALGNLCPDVPVSVVPNTVDTDFYLPSSDANRGSQEPVMLFQGSMDWYPNRDAVEYFVQDILPKIRAVAPNAKFIVAGRNPPPQFVAELTAVRGVEFTGTVADMRPYLASATIVVVPLRLGSGTRIKILEACAAGKPVVSTHVGAEGLDLHDGREIVLADEPSEFASAVAALLADPVRASSMARAARAVIDERYSQHALRVSLKNVLENFHNQKRTN
ncbi:MAG TPA: glycosyltransferase family 4 protein [Verrucomicrobiae bacterium]|nr:glycosyltransferase family 4 protein [Verrucomicrobiae bacterium]